MEPLISIIVMLIIVGLALWLVRFLPLDDTIKQIIKGVVIVFVILYLLSMLAPSLGHVHLVR